MAEPTGKARGMGRGLKITLILSLAFNLFIVAVVAGSALSHHRWRPHGDIGAGIFTEVLTREDRRALRDAFIAAEPGFRDHRAQTREDMARLAEVLRAEPWDPSAVDALIAGHSARMTERFDLGRRLISDRIAAMSATDRAALADRIDAELKRRQRR